MMKLRIDNYSFGRMTIGDKKFTSDVLIYPDGRIHGNWRRQRGHNLVPEDIISLLESAPQRLIIGTGNSGLMAVSPSVMERCHRIGTEVEVLSTGAAVKRFNEAAEGSVRVAACFHLTC